MRARGTLRLVMGIERFGLINGLPINYTMKKFHHSNTDKCMFCSVLSNDNGEFLTLFAPASKSSSLRGMGGTSP